MRRSFDTLAAVVRDVMREEPQSGSLYVWWVYVSMMEAYRKLEAGLVGQKRERQVPTSEQLTMDVVSIAVPGNRSGGRASISRAHLGGQFPL